MKDGETILAFDSPRPLFGGAVGRRSRRRAGSPMNRGWRSG
jgi:hypothetical protein